MVKVVGKVEGSESVWGRFRWEGGRGGACDSVGGEVDAR